ncbi:MAG: F0F1 ATP synthase subunit alpha [Candidatus Roizmanbacteria bacterium]
MTTLPSNSNFSPKDESISPVQQGNNSFQYYLTSIGEYGIVKEVKHPLATVEGIPGVKLREIVFFENGEAGEVFSIDREKVRVMTFSREPVKLEWKVSRTGIFISVPVGEELLGQVIDPLGRPISHPEQFVSPAQRRDLYMNIDGIATRRNIQRPFITGMTVIDMMIPLGRGQKELIIGDRKTGKSSFLLTTIKKQIEEGTIIIYAAIARKKNDIKRLQEYFQQEKISDKVIIVATTAHDSPSLIYRTPYSAMTIAEYFREQGKDTLVVLDDLSAHAKFYREIALLSGRFPGRDSYPGDIFYVHARLLERCGNFFHPTKGEVSITALPVVEIVEGDLTGYVQTNIMGMTDGHIFFDSNAFYRGRRPAVDLFLSVTRVGKQTISPLRREINRELSSFLANYEKMQNYSQFGAELSAKVKNILKLGQKLYVFFNQHYNTIVPEDIQTVLFGMLWSHIFDELPDRAINDARDSLIAQCNADANLAQTIKGIGTVENLYALLISITKNKEQLLQLCSIKNESEKK